MSDTLRTRIAAAVARELVQQAQAAGEYQTRDCYMVADAVIAALGMTQERRHPIVTESGITAGKWMIPTESRYVTEWLDDA